MGTDTSNNFDELNSFLKQHDAVDFRSADLLNTTSLESFSLLGDNVAGLLQQLKAYQRLLRVLPTNSPTSDDVPSSDLALKLLALGIDSALKITNLGKANFLSTTRELFSDTPDLADKVYKRALVARNLVASQYIKQRQQLEPHARAVGLNL